MKQETKEKINQRIKDYISLFLVFFKIGLFSFGGGYATIPFLYHISEHFGWFTEKELTQIIAVASKEPIEFYQNIDYVLETITDFTNFKKFFNL